MVCNQNTDLRQRQLQVQSDEQYHGARFAAIAGTWSETSRNINGNIEGRAAGGVIQVVANAPGFSANISLTTRGNKTNPWL